LASIEPPTNGTAWRIQSLESRVSRLEGIKPDVIAERVENHAREMLDLRDEIRSLKRALYTFALSISGSAIAFGIAVFQVIR